MPRSSSPSYRDRDRRYGDDSPRRHSGPDRDRNRPWSGYNQGRDSRDWDDYSRSGGRGGPGPSSYRDRYRDDERDRDRDYRRQYRPPRSRSPVSGRGSPVKSRAPSVSAGGRSASPEEGQITSPARTGAQDQPRKPVPIPFYRDRIQDRRDRERDRDMEDRRRGPRDGPRYGSRYNPGDQSGPSRRPRSPYSPPRHLDRRSRSSSQSSYSYSSHSRSSPEKSSLSPRRRPPSQPREGYPPPPQGDKSGSGFPSVARPPPSGPRSDRPPPAGPRALNSEFRPFPPPPLPPAPSLAARDRSNSSNPYGGSTETSTANASMRPLPLEISQARRSSPYQSSTHSEVTSPLDPVSTPAQEIENPYGRPINATSQAVGNPGRLSWAERRVSGQQPTASASPVHINQDYQPSTASSPMTNPPDRQDAASAVKIEPPAWSGRIASHPASSEDSKPALTIVKQEELNLNTQPQMDAKIRSELPDIRLWSTMPKWELDLANHYSHLAALQQTTMRAQSALRLATATVADAEAERIAAGERRKVAETQLVANTLGMGVGILGSMTT
ncbi:hypothetical protein BD324DRAFT_637018 [Kockovaella imperatae]|uniref:Uncharacterized protein n=1 Tax=Kockovaella imperatae TaxID=4999 RepID=A0A1Y1U826_9TREE|nr:hypothetical protein BD324DRAFT_637018 [Kockovaella imperatae]ORX34189.1 hypothetical protein BD324DRAFT_637018 [Kockovaella imperatae]